MATFQHEACDPEDPEVMFKVNAVHEVGEKGDREVVMGLLDSEASKMQAVSRGSDGASLERRKAMAENAENPPVSREEAEWRHQQGNRRNAVEGWSSGEESDHLDERENPQTEYPHSYTARDSAMQPRRRLEADVGVARGMSGTGVLREDPGEYCEVAAEQRGSHGRGWQGQPRSERAGFQQRHPVPRREERWVEDRNHAAGGQQEAYGWRDGGSSSTRANRSGAMNAVEWGNGTNHAQYSNNVRETLIGTGRMRRPSFTPDRFDGTTAAWRDYKKHFESCAMLNQWNEHEKASFLAVSLKGQAQTVLSDARNIASYQEIVRLLELRFGPGGKAEMYLSQLRGRSRKSGESLQELGHAIRRLTQFAYPELDYLAQDRLARTHFGDAIQSPEIRMRLFNSQAADLDEAIRVATEIEAFLESERMRQGRSTMNTRHVRLLETVDSPAESEMRLLREKLEFMEGELQRERSARAKYLSRGGARQQVKCYGCGELGHYRRDCPAVQGNEMQPTPRVGGRC